LDNYNDDPQLAELKQWWDEYGRSIIFGVILAVVSLSGWNAWTSYQTQQSEQASTLYYTMMSAYEELQLLAENDGDQTESDDENNKLTEFQAAIDSLKEQYGKTEYAYYASFQSAKYSVEKGDFDAAAAELKSIIDRNPSDSIHILAKMRLARVLLASQQYAEALRLIEGKNLGIYEADFNELAGDIYMQQGESENAFIAYAKAKDLSDTPSENLEMKYYNLLSE